MTIAFVFPGQGSQTVGMSKEFVEAFPEAKQAFEEVDDTLSYKLSQIILEGPQETLTLTENAQPALMTVSMAVTRALEAQIGQPLSNLCSYMAGHSLGEYSALCALGVFTLNDTARLLRTRGVAMQSAVPVGKGGMAAILGLEQPDVSRLVSDAAQGEICVIANDNSPGQIVISGHMGAIERAIALAPERGAKRAIALPVSAPFHCSLMQPAAEKMAQALADSPMKDAAKPLIANVTAMPAREASLIRTLLVEQVTDRVRWRESGENMGSLGVTKVVEIGAGRVLSGLLKRIDPSLDIFAINTPSDMDSFLKTL